VACPIACECKACGVDLVVGSCVVLTQSCVGACGVLVSTVPSTPSIPEASR
jgi:hypothetical protein